MNNYDYDLLALELDEWLMRISPDQVSLPMIAAHLDIEQKTATRVIQHHRRHLGDSSLAILCAPVQNVWLYWLSRDPEEIKGYGARRLDDTEARVRTIKAVADRAVVITDGRTLAGKRARIISRHIRHLLEDLESIEDLGLS
jgi:hypothetical protein